MSTDPTVPEITATPRELVAADGYRLRALHYPAAGTPAGHLVIAGATGVPQGFYRRFAQHAAGQGFHVTTLDYRGIGLSRPASLRGFRMDYLDWARLDLAAAVDAVPEDGLPLVMVGHSYGGHAFGLLPNHHRVARFVTLATGAGWHGWMPPLERLRVLFMWRVLGPLLTRWKGYLPWSLLGMGEDLPLGVYRQWRYWCRFPRYFFDDPAMRAEGLAERFAAVRTPIVALNALDDRWAPPASRDAFLAAYRNAPVRALDLHPASLGRRSIGHMGYFRPAARPLWDEWLGWLRDGRAATA
ncbi:alpha/beta hydrolase family protein [Rubrivivax albus]|uniref:Alpha/beta fold hydrolase n=1 Tax=Rubrivivax albus TaxID=2499835 RepID=A0A3S2U897_9BURK|nr:alpha/beta fold hydrolase [Rubrivivax albus]RVT50925.1 alpha/beta fold hydrolase [Rubrivivax albus]